MASAEPCKSRTTTIERCSAATSVRFVIGSDVIGAMGPDLVPVDPARVAKFEKDHGGTRESAARSTIDEKALAP